MKIVYFSQEGSLLSFAMRAQRYGHKVTLVTRGKVGEGIVDVKPVSNLTLVTAQNFSNNADLLVFDHPMIASGHLSFWCWATQ